MPRETVALLIDIRDAAQHIAHATTGVAYEEFLGNLDKRNRSCSAS